jgi:hypothetical protein
MHQKNDATPTFEGAKYKVFWFIPIRTDQLIYRILKQKMLYARPFAANS